MANIASAFDRAKKSSFRLFLLNLGLSRKVPFNRPHKFRVVKLTDNSIVTRLPYRTLNLNHIHSLHACALATLSEFSTGAFLLSKLDPAKYRIILKELKMEYHYQGKTDVVAHFGLTQSEINDHILIPLQSGPVDITCEVKTKDTEDNHISTGWITWQIKDWKKVRTKV